MKKGASHIEIILSFLIFIGAISFALYFFRPTHTDRLVETSLDYIFREIEKNASSVLSVYSVNIDNEAINAAGEEDINVLRINGFNDWEVPIELNPFVFDLEEEVLQAERGNIGEDYFIKINSPSGWGNVDFIYIYFSEEFEEQTVSGSEISDSNYYQIGSSYSENVLSWQKIQILGQAYVQDYFRVKGEFNIPNRVDFGFLVRINDTTNVSALPDLAEKKDVYTQQKRVKILKDGRIVYGDLVASVW